MADDNRVPAVYLDTCRRAGLVGLVVIQSLDKNALISSSHGRDQKELKEREWLGNSDDGEVRGRGGGLPRQLVTQRQAQHRRTLMLHQPYYSIAPLPHHVRESCFSEQKLNVQLNFFLINLISSY